MTSPSLSSLPGRLAARPGAAPWRRPIRRARVGRITLSEGAVTFRTPRRSCGVGALRQGAGPGWRPGAGPGWMPSPPGASPLPLRALAGRPRPRDGSWKRPWRGPCMPSRPWSAGRQSRLERRQPGQRPAVGWFPAPAGRSSSPPIAAARPTFARSTSPTSPTSRSSNGPHPIAATHRFAHRHRPEAVTVVPASTVRDGRLITAATLPATPPPTSGWVSAGRRTGPGWRRLAVPGRGHQDEAVRAVAPATWPATCVPPPCPNGLRPRRNGVSHRRSPAPSRSGHSRRAVLPPPTRATKAPPPGRTDVPPPPSAQPMAGRDAATWLPPAATSETVR